MCCTKILYFDIPQNKNKHRRHKQNKGKKRQGWRLELDRPAGGYHGLLRIQAHPIEKSGLVVSPCAMSHLYKPCIQCCDRWFENNRRVQKPRHYRGDGYQGTGHKNDPVIVDVDGHQGPRLEPPGKRCPPSKRGGLTRLPPSANGPGGYRSLLANKSELLKRIQFFLAE